jgi:hypothetical protein
MGGWIGNMLKVSSEAMGGSVICRSEECKCGWIGSIFEVSNEGIDGLIMWKWVMNGWVDQGYV